MIPIKITKEELHEKFEYVDGKLKYKTRPANRIKVGQEAGCAGGKNGYHQIHIKGRIYRTHQLIWVMFHGCIDTSLIMDHINRDILDNRIENLRLVTVKQNAQNQAGKGYKTHNKGRYSSVITVDGKSISLGTYGTKEEAHAVYLKAKEEYHPYYRSLNKLENIENLSRGL